MSKIFKIAAKLSSYAAGTHTLPHVASVHGMHDAQRRRKKAGMAAVIARNDRPNGELTVTVRTSWSRTPVRMYLMCSGVHVETRSELYPHEFETWAHDWARKNGWTIVNIWHDDSCDGDRYVITFAQ